MQAVNVLASTRKLLVRTIWIAVLSLIGLFIGGASVILPPTVPLACVALLGLLMLWTVPEMQIVPYRSVVTIFLINVVVLQIVPGYYTIAIQGLPWVSIRRVILYILLALFFIRMASSSESRSIIVTAFRSNTMIYYLFVGLCISSAASLILAPSPASSVQVLFTQMTSFVTLLPLTLLVVADDKAVRFVMKLVVVGAIIASLAGLLEFYLQRPYYLDFLPMSLKLQLIDQNPALKGVVFGGSARDGVYRAGSIYVTALSFAESAAMIMPLASFFLFHGVSRREQVLGGIGAGLCFASLVIANARGGVVSSIFAMGLFFAIWAFRYNRAHPGRMGGGFVLTLYPVGVVLVVLAIIFVPRAHHMVMGSGATQSSNDARKLEWELAKPKILANPVLGYGMGSSGSVVGYYPGGSDLPTVDSYAITILVDQGVPGFISFFGLIAASIWFNFRSYLTRAGPAAELGIALGCSLVSYGVNRLVLSQIENQPLFFELVGLTLIMLQTLQRQLTASTRASTAPQGRAVQAGSMISPDSRRRIRQALP